MGGGAVVAAIAAARKHGIERVLDSCRMGQATTADRAQPLQLLGIEPNNWVDELRKDGILKSGSEPDTWYLDEIAYVSRRDGRSMRAKRIVWTLMGIMLLGAAIGLIVMRMSPGTLM